MIAHRGDTKAALENTLPAFEAALKLGVDGIELDLQLSKDGEVVVFHDEDLQRLAGRPEKISKMTLREIQNVRLKNSDARIPTLSELLDLVKDRGLLNLELKAVRFCSSTLEEKTARWVEAFNLSESILISSFYTHALWRLKKIAPYLNRGYLFEKYSRWHRGLIPLIEPFSVNAPLSGASQEFIDAMHQSSWKVFVWTVNHENDMKRLIQGGIDGMITDDPRKLISLLKF